MKLNIRTIALATLALTASLSLTVHAETKPVCNRVNIPFAFNYGNAHFAPGVYNIAMLETDLMRFRTDDGRHVALAMVKAEYNQARKTGKLVFEKYGNRYFLHEVWAANSDSHVRLFETRQEKRASKEMASQATSPDRIELALSTEPSAGAGE